MPAPPGAQPPAPKVHIPDASHDPFGAMNAMAGHAAQTRGPEIVVVNDGGPVESVEHKSHAVTYGKIAAMILVPLLIGIAMGQISSSAKRSNEVIEDAASIRDDLKKLNNGMVGLNDILLDAKTRGAGGRGFKMNDQALTKELDGYEFPKVDSSVVYQSAMYELPVEVVENLLYYYQETAQLKEMLEEHVTKSKQDAKAFDEAGKRLATKYAPGRYGAIIKMPTEDEAKNGFPPKALLVELGQPLCGGKPGQCPRPDGFTVRDNAKNLSWSNRKFPPAGTVDPSGLLFIQPTPVLMDAIAGSEASLAQTFYAKRIQAIDEKVAELTEIGQKLASQLNSKAGESKKFTFFM